MTYNKHSIFHIEINKNYQIKFTIIDDDNKHHVIKINEDQEEDFITPTLSLNMNDIILNNQSDNSIEFIKDFILQPEQFKEYTINYQNQQHSVIFEVLFGIYISQVRKRIEKEWIIDKMVLKIPVDNYLISKRIKTSLHSINLENFSITSYNNYEEQGEILQSILHKHEEYEKYKRIFERSNQTNLLDLSKPLNGETFEQLSKQFTTKKRSATKFCQLDNYCIFLASQWFDDIEDHVNLVRVCKRLRLNMEKFHFNPVSLTKETREYFQRSRIFSTPWTN